MPRAIELSRVCREQKFAEKCKVALWSWRATSSMPDVLPRWTPGSSIQDHTGRTISPEMVFYAPPPPEIGEVLTAHSGLYRSGTALEKPVAKRVMLLFTLGGLLLGAFLGAGFTHGNWIGALVGAVIVGGLVGLWIYRREGRKLACSYTGTLGVARFLDPRDATGQRFLFSDAAELQTSFLGRKGGTNFNYQWWNAQGKRVYQLEGG